MKHLIYTVLTGLIFVLLGCTVVEELDPFVEENSSCNALVDDVIALFAKHSDETDFRDEYGLIVLEKIIDVENITGTLEPDMLLREADEEYKAVHVREADYICRGLALTSEGFPSQSVIYFYRHSLTDPEGAYIYGFTDVHR